MGREGRRELELKVEVSRDARRRVAILRGELGRWCGVTIMLLYSR